MNPQLATWSRIVLALLFAFIAQSSRAELMSARAADALINSIGINTHLGYNDTVYGNYSGIIRPRLQELGIRHVRDHVLRNRPEVDSRFQDLHDQLGIKALFIADPRQCSPTQAWNYVKALGPYRVSMVEGPNEPDLNLGPTWANTTRSYQRSLYTLMKADSATAQIPVAAPSLSTEASANSLGSLSRFLDFGNMHNYYAGHHPGSGGWGDNGYGSLTWQLTQSRKVCGAKPVVSTETGYHNATNSTSTHLSTPEWIVAKYLPRLFCYQFYRGIARSYPYEFIDQGTNPLNHELNFGLLRNDGTPKASFLALKNLIALLRDPGTDFSPSALDYTLSGDLANIYQLLLQKRDGTFYLAVWLEASSWNPLTKVESFPAARSLTLRLNTTIDSAATCVPNEGTNWTAATIVDGTISLTVPDQVLLVRLVPVPGALGASTRLVPAGSSWKYLDDGSDQGAAWRAVDFDDNGWSNSIAQLGYDHGGPTSVRYGQDTANKHMTTYFRRTFELPDPSLITRLTVWLVRDDGALVYLNGTEVFRSNMPAGMVNFTTPALTGVGYENENTFFATNIPTALLQTGTNVIAVEVHQNVSSSSDLSFDLELLASLHPPRLAMDLEPDGVVIRWPGIYSNFQLWSANALVAATDWQRIEAPITEGDVWRSFTAPLNESPMRLFRLSVP